MSKNKHEAELVKKALVVGALYVKKRGYGEIEATDSRNLKIEYAYRLLVHDKKIAPLPPNQREIPKMKHRLAMWVTHELPDDHELLQ